MVDSTLFAAAARIVDAVDSDERRHIPMNKLYPSLVSELSQVCPGFTKQQYEEALQHAFSAAR